MRSSKSIKILIELLLTVAAILLCLVPITNVLAGQDDSGGGFITFYKEEKNSIDLMVFGSSHAACTVNNDILWRENGIASYTLSCGGQNILETSYYIKEALKYQKPKVILVETLYAGGPPFDENTGHYTVDMGTIYRNNQGMHWSPLYLKMVHEQCRNYGINKNLKYELMLKFPVFHDRYVDLDKTSFINETAYIRGYKGDTSVGEAAVPELTEERTPLSELAENSIREIIKICHEKGIEAVFFCAPYNETKDECAQQNSIADLLADENVPYIDYNRIYQDIQLDFSTDFRSDGNHLNNSGAEKVTKDILGFLTETYDFPDRRGAPGYERWDLESRYLADKRISELLQGITDAEQYFSMLGDKRQDFDYIISFSGNYDAAGYDAFGQWLPYIGIDANTYYTGGTAVFHKGELMYYSGADEAGSFQGKMGDTPITVEKIENRAEENDANEELGDTIYIDNRNYTYAVNGLNIIVFDSEINKVVDRAYINIYDSREICHLKND